MVGTSAWASARMRALRRPISAVSRPTARTRRSSDARARLPNSTGVSPDGARSGGRARVSASMPLLLACRARNRRRSAALAEVTRSTVWPRRGEEHRHRQPRRAGRLDDHDQLGARLGAGQRGSLQSGQAADRGTGAAPGTDAAGGVQHHRGVLAGHAQVNAKQADRGWKLHRDSFACDEPAHPPRPSPTGRRPPATVQVLATLPGPQAWHGFHSCAAGRARSRATCPLPPDGAVAGAKEAINRARRPGHPEPLRAELLAPPRTSRACHATRNPSSDQPTEAPYMSRCSRTVSGWLRMAVVNVRTVALTASRAFLDG
jgi:hypothetical protein